MSRIADFRSLYFSATAKDWHGLGVALNLGRMLDTTPEFVKVMKTPCRTVPLVNTVVEARLQVIDETPGQVSSKAQKSGPGFIFQWPHYVSFDSECSLGLLTVCSLIEALDFFGQKEEAQRLAVALSLSILTFYKEFIQKSEEENPSFPAIDFLEEEMHLDSDAASTREDREAVSAVPTCTDLGDVQLHLTTFAFLFDMLSRSHDVDRAIFEISGERLENSQSLGFQLGLLGLFVPILPTRKGNLEVRVIIRDHTFRQFVRSLCALYST